MLIEQSSIWTLKHWSTIHSSYYGNLWNHVTPGRDARHTATRWNLLRWIPTPLLRPEFGTNRCVFKLSVSMFAPEKLSVCLAKPSNHKLVVPLSVRLSVQVHVIWSLTDAQIQLGSAEEQQRERMVNLTDCADTVTPIRSDGFHCTRPRHELITTHWRAWSRSSW